MLIQFTHILNIYNVDRNKYILHIGADECQEKDEYNKNGFTDDRIIWIEGNSETVKRVKNAKNNILIYDALISDLDDDIVDFIITNNMQSSSILELEEHLKEHPYVFETQRYKKSTITVNTFLKKYNIDPSLIEFVNIDIQGAELLALKGMSEVLKYAKYLYLEVNNKHLYRNCALVDEIDSFVLNYGFERKMINMTQHGWGDALYVKK